MRCNLCVKLLPYVLFVISVLYLLTATLMIKLLMEDQETASARLLSFETEYIHKHSTVNHDKDTADMSSSSIPKRSDTVIEPQNDKLFPLQYFGTASLEFIPATPLAYSEYMLGTSPYQLSPSILQKSDELANERKVLVRNAMQHIWDHYSQEGIFGSDEIKPVSNTRKDIDGVARTLVDSLDTLWIMGLKEEFYQARDYVRDHLTHESIKKNTSVFETNIRSLGGLLSAYDWSKDVVFLNKAIDLGNRLIKVFDTPSGLPYALIALKSGLGTNGWQGETTNSAEAGTFLIEFRYLSKVSGDPIYGEKAELALKKILDLKTLNGLYSPVMKNLVEKVEAVQRNYGKYSFGCYNDSFYEYLLKGWLQTGQTEQYLLDSYIAAIDGMHQLLLKKSLNGLTYISEASTKTLQVESTMEHLTCFMGGLLALGAHSMSLMENKEDFQQRIDRDMVTAKALTYTCYQMYASNETGLSAEKVSFLSGTSRGNIRGYQPANESEIRSVNGKYILRPEVVESLYILNKLTGDPIYREWGWEIFKAIEKYCKTPYAYGAFRDVTLPNSVPMDEMESFFPAETLKYMYLLFDPESEVDLDKHVFNTEAHPLRRFSYIL